MRRDGQARAALAMFVAVTLTLAAGGWPQASTARQASSPGLNHMAPAAQIGRIDRLPAGSGPEYVEYQAPPQIHNRFVVGGVLVYTGLFFGGLLLLGRRRIAGLALGGATVAAGVALMLSHLM